MSDVGEPRYLYIAGRGHSGTTALLTLLGNVPGVFGGGEVISGVGNVDPGSDLCSCGAVLEDCPVWGAIDLDFRERCGITLREAGHHMARNAHVRFIPRYVRRALFRDDPQKHESTRHHDAFKRSAAAVASAHTVADSTKELSRCILVLWSDPTAKALVLTRHPSRVVASYRRRLQGGAPFKFLRKLYYPDRGFPRMFVTTLVYVSWTVGGLIAEVIRAVFRGRVLTLRYEDLVEAPDRELRRVGHFMDVDLEPVIERIGAGEALSLGHQIGGNELRHESTFVFNARGASPVPFWGRVAAWLLCWPMLLRYGYR